MSDGQAGAVKRRPGRPSVTAKLERVRLILEQTLEQDGKGLNLQERHRRKAYRAGITRALDEIAGRGS